MGTYYVWSFLSLGNASQNKKQITDFSNETRQKKARVKMNDKSNFSESQIVAANWRLRNSSLSGSMGFDQKRAYTSGISRIESRMQMVVDIIFQGEVQNSIFTV